MDPKEITASDSTELSKTSEPCIGLKPSDKQPVTCQVCTAANADGYCKDCCKFLCLNCFQLHAKFGPFSTHELTSLQETATSVPSEEVKKALTMNCLEHDDPLRVFCETCEELICRDCTIRTHKDHNYDLVSNCYNKHYQILESTLNAVEKKKKVLMIKITDLTDRENEIKEQGELVKQEIDVKVEEMIDVIRQSARNLKGKVDSVIDSKLKVAMIQKKSAKTSCGRLEECSGYVKQSLEMDTHQQVLLSKKTMMKQMNGVMEEINVEDYTPIEKSDIQFIKNDKIKLHHIGDVSYTTSGLHQCIVKIDSHEVTLEKNSFSFPLSIESPNSSLVTVPLSSLSCSVISTTPINTTVTTTDHPGVYRIHCTPAIHGSHQVNIRVCGIQLESVSVVVPFNPYVDTITPIRTIEGLAGPWGVAISNDGHVVVTERGCHRVTVLDKEGKKIKSFSTSSTSGDIKFFDPLGITVTSDNFILVTDDHKIQKISMDEKLIASVGQKGAKTLEFNLPFDIAISPTTGQIYVADSCNNRIQVLNPDLTFSFTFKCKEKEPSYIAIDNKGIVYVSYWWSHCIHKFTAGGKFVSEFGTKGFNPGQLCYPKGMAITNNLLCVCEGGNGRVSVFSTDGKFMRCIGSRGTNKDQFHSPHGITFDNEGYLYICDFSNNRLVVY